MSTVNSSKTAFCLFSLAHEGFEKYKMTGKATTSLEGIKCKLQVKVSQLLPSRLVAILIMCSRISVSIVGSWKEYIVSEHPPTGNENRGSK